MAFKHTNTYLLNKNAYSGTQIVCPNTNCCHWFIKKQYNHSYCSDKCKYEYYDQIDPEFKDHYPPEKRIGNKYKYKPKEYSIKLTLL